MHGLSRPVLLHVLTRGPRGRAGERGAVASIVGILLVTGVVMGFGAISIDVGQMMWERRQLQNGADASALALAQTCARATCTDTDPSSTSINDANASDAANGYQPTAAYPNGQCGHAIATLPSCNPTTGALADCPDLPTWLTANQTIPYVEAHTETESAAGVHLLPTWVARAMPGGLTDSVVRACARVAFGTPGSGGDLPLTISGCEWMRSTNGNSGGGSGSYYPGPIYNSSSSPDYGYGGGGQPAWPAPAATPPVVSPGGEVILVLQNPSSPGGNGNQLQPSPCANWQGHALPGGFGVLETFPGDPCRLVEYPYHWMHTDPGSSTACDLNSRVGTVVSVPIFNCTADAQPSTEPPVGDCLQGNGSNAWFHRQGYAAFYLSGYHITTAGAIPNQRASLVSGSVPCSGGNSCISGWFVSDSLSATSISGPPGGVNDFGSIAILPAG
jgi:Flp pilus assembly protein TadG